jgi:hypothetical protein
LVKDGATAIEALGDSIDASLVDLKGGTSGQVLSKNSNTDMDFVWVTSDDANAIQNTIVDAKGDLITATAADTPARLAVGANGETLVADSSTSTGLRYIPATVMSNPVINSCFDIWQRGTSIAGSTTAFSADRWQSYRSVAGSTYSRQATGDTTNLPNVQYCARVQRDSGNTSTTGIFLWQNFETTNSIPFAGKTITFSFYARAGANYSSASSALPYQVYTGTGTDQNQLAGYTGQATAISGTATLTTTWQRFTATATLAATATEINTQFYFTPVGTAGANDYFEVTGVQIDIGSVALPVRRNAATIQGELAACQRYYYYLGVPFMPVTSTSGGTTVQGVVSFPVTMRIAPTASTNMTNANYDSAGPAAGKWCFNVPGTGNSTKTGTATIAQYTSLTGSSFVSTGATYSPVPIGVNVSSTSYLDFNSEL